MGVYSWSCWQTLPDEGRARFIFRAAQSHTDAGCGVSSPFPVKRIRTGQSNTGSGLFRIVHGTSHTLIDWTLTQRSRIRVPVHRTFIAYPKTCPTAILLPAGLRL